MTAPRACAHLTEVTAQLEVVAASREAEFCAEKGEVKELAQRVKVQLVDISGSYKF